MNRTWWLRGLRPQPNYQCGSVRYVNNANIKPVFGKVKPAWMRSKGNKPGYPVSNPAMLRRIGVDKNLQERINDMYQEEIDQLHERVNIGLSPLPAHQNVRRTKARRGVRNADLERASRHGTLEVSLEDVNRLTQESGQLFEIIVQAADFYGIYEDLFGIGKYFQPSVHLNIEYAVDEDKVLPVHRGNIIKPCEAARCPDLQFTVPISDSHSYWTLVMTNLDGHFVDEEAEYLHWMVANIAGSRIEDGKCLVPYLQPFPASGTGYHRIVFVLYHHDKPLDFGGYDLSGEQKVNLASRTFKTRDFLCQYESELKPAGLAFFQSDYDSTLHGFFHNVLEMREPRFEYNFIPSYTKPWLTEDPGRHEPFNTFLDTMRDPKEVQEEVLKKKLARLHPFDGDLDRHIQFPNAHGPQVHRYQDVDEHGSWRIREMERERLRQGVFKDMDWTKLGYDPPLD